MLINIAILCLCICHTTHTRDMYTTYTTHTKPLPHYTKNTDTPEYTATDAIILTALLGGLSGLLCREFEKRILCDILPLRIANIIIWGIAQDRAFKNIIAELNEHTQTKQNELLKKICWITSWTTYLLGD